VELELMPGFEPSPGRNARFAGTFTDDQGENPGFSTFFSTVVENFGPGPRRRARSEGLDDPSAPVAQGSRKEHAAGEARL
jgi:hypothetical protein